LLDQLGRLAAEDAGWPAAVRLPARPLGLADFDLAQPRVDEN